MVGSPHTEATKRRGTATMRAGYMIIYKKHIVNVVTALTTMYAVWSTSAKTTPMENAIVTA